MSVTVQGDPQWQDLIPALEAIAFGKGETTVRRLKACKALALAGAPSRPHTVTPDVEPWAFRPGAVRGSIAPTPQDPHHI